MALLIDEKKLGAVIVEEIVKQDVHKKLAQNMIGEFMEYKGFLNIPVKYFLIASMFAGLIYKLTRK